jgi:hypothetical protein
MYEMRKNWERNAAPKWRSVAVALSTILIIASVGGYAQKRPMSRQATGGATGSTGTPSDATRSDHGARPVASREEFVTAWRANGHHSIAILAQVFGLRHPPPLDDLTPLDRKRRLIGYATIVIFFLILTPLPFS